jgi:hypothetical protein
MTRLYNETSYDLAVTDAGQVIDWPQDAGSNLFAKVKATAAGSDMHLRTGISGTLTGGQVVRVADAPVSAPVTGPFDFLLADGETAVISLPRTDGHNALAARCPAAGAGTLTLQPEV